MLPAGAMSIWLADSFKAGVHHDHQIMDQVFVGMGHRNFSGRKAQRVHVDHCFGAIKLRLAQVAGKELRARCIVSLIGKGNKNKVVPPRPALKAMVERRQQ